MIYLLPYGLHLVLLALALGAWLALRGPLGIKLAAWLVAPPTVAVMAYHLSQVSEPGHFLYADFYKAYYPGAEAAWRGDHEWFLRLLQARDFVNLPIVAYLFVPFVWIGREWAGHAFSVLGVLATIALLALLIRRAKLSGASLVAFLGVAAVFGPLWYSFGEGNTTHIVLFLLILGLLAAERGYDVLAGLVLGFAALVKLPLLLFGVYYAFRGRWRIALGGAAVLLTAAVLSLGVFGWELNAYWHKRCVAPFTERPMAGYNVQSIDGFLIRLKWGPHLLRDWEPLKPGTLHKVASKVAILGLFATAVAALCRALGKPPLPWRAPEMLSPDAEARLFCIVLNLALVTSPLSWTHYYLFLLLPYAFWLGGRLIPASDRLGPGLMLASACLASLPAFIVEPDPATWLAAITSRTVVSLHLLGGLLCLGALLRAAWLAPRPEPPDAIGLDNEPAEMAAN